MALPGLLELDGGAGLFELRPWPSRRLPSTTFSSTGLGAPSTRSLASLRPRLVSARTSLMTWIFLSPAAVRTTSNSSFSSAASAPPPPPAAGGGGHGDGSGGGDAELLLEVLEQLAQLEHGHVGDGVEDLFLGGHGAQLSWRVGRVGRRVGCGARRLGVGRRWRRRPRRSAARPRRRRSASAAASVGSAASSAAASAAGGSSARLRLGHAALLSMRALRP